MITKVKHVSIPVEDQDRALAFYQSKLGFILETDAAFSEKQRWIELSLPGGETKIVLFTPEGQEERVGTFSNIVFTSSDVVNTYNDLVKKGVLFISPPKQEPWGTYCLLQDSEGNVICLSSDT